MLFTTTKKSRHQKLHLMLFLCIAENLRMRKCGEGAMAYNYILLLFADLFQATKLSHFFSSCAFQFFLVCTCCYFFFKFFSVVCYIRLTIETTTWKAKLKCTKNAHQRRETFMTSTCFNINDKKWRRIQEWW